MPNAKTNAGCKPAMPGRTTIKIPRKPTRMATRRRQPIHSPRNGPARSATTNGARKTTVTVWSSLRCSSARKLKTVVIAIRTERTISSFSLRVPSSAERGRALNSVNISRNCPANRIQAIWTMGSEERVARYLAEVSRPEKSTSATNIRPIAFIRSRASRSACSNAVGLSCGALVPAARASSFGKSSLMARSHSVPKPACRGVISCAVVGVGDMALSFFRLGLRSFEHPRARRSSALHWARAIHYGLALWPGR